MTMPRLRGCGSASSLGASVGYKMSANMHVCTGSNSHSVIQESLREMDDDDDVEGENGRVGLLLELSVMPRP